MADHEDIIRSTNNGDNESKASPLSNGDTLVDADELLAQSLREKLDLSDGASTATATTAALTTHPMDDQNPWNRPMTILCDLGYGIPKEPRPRKEKILAISKQLVNFLTWQHNHAKNSATRINPCAMLEIVSCPDSSTQKALQDRMEELWTATNDHEFPTNISFSPDSLEEWVTTNGRYPASGGGEMEDSCTHAPVVVYLSPDADQSLDPEQPPPRIVVVGLLIDRRTILVNKSKDRAQRLALTTARWPLDCIVANMSPSEPLNVDCVLEGMQQWEWNCAAYMYAGGEPDETIRQQRRAACADALVQALEHHVQRHPERPIHEKCK